MAMRINQNIAALNALRHLNRTSEETQTTLERLSSGRKLNRAADGPAALVISELMESQIESVGQAINNSETSMSMIQTAEGALNEVSSILVTLRQLALHAANSGTNDIKMLEADQSEIENLLTTIRRISKHTQFGTRSLLDGSNSVQGVTVGDGLEFVSAENTTKPSSSEGYKVNITQVATRSMTVATRTLTMEDAFANYVITEGGTTISVDPIKNPELKAKINKIMDAALRTGDDEIIDRAQNMIQHLITQELQKQIDEAGMNLEVFVYKPAETFGEIASDWDLTEEQLWERYHYPTELKEMVDEEVMVIRHKQYGSQPTFTVTTSIEDFFAEEAQANVAISAIPGRDIEGTIGGAPEVGAGDPAIGNGQLLTAAEGTGAEGLTIRYKKDTDDVLYEIFNRVQRQMTGLTLEERTNDYLVGEDKPGIGLFSDIIPEIDGYVHVSQNSLAFQIGPNQGQQIRVSINSINPADLGNNIDNESGFTSLDDVNVIETRGAQDALGIIDAAIDEISGLRAKLGSFQKNALDSNLNSLRVYKENLSSSASQLTDTDMAAEMSTFVKNQILMETGTAMLAQANQMPKAVLQLLNSNAG